jgi:hypothetical protein
MRKPIVGNRRIHIGVIACRKRQRRLTLATKLPELEIFQVNIERLHTGDEKAWQAFAIASAENKKFEKTRLGLEEKIRKTRALALFVKGPSSCGGVRIQAGHMVSDIAVGVVPKLAPHASDGTLHAGVLMGFLAMPSDTLAASQAQAPLGMPAAFAPPAA